MTQVEKFQFECMETPSLANEMRLVKEEMRHFADMKKIYKDDFHRKSEYRNAYVAWKNAKIRYNELEKIMKSRQLTLF